MLSSIIGILVFSFVLLIQKEIHFAEFTYYSFSPSVLLLRNYVSNENKIRYSNEVPYWFDEIMCGLMLGDGHIRLNGHYALLSVQQTHPELVNKLWEICSTLNMVINPVKTLKRSNWKTIYYFQTLTMPYFSNLRQIWYPVLNGIGTKSIPANIDNLLTPLAFAHWIMGDGGFDGHGRGAGRVTLSTNNFTQDEVKILQNTLLSKFNIESSLQTSKNSDPIRGYAIRIPARCLDNLRSIVGIHIYPSLKYKIGL